MKKENVGLELLRGSLREMWDWEYRKIRRFSFFILNAYILT